MSQSATFWKNPGNDCQQNTPCCQRALIKTRHGEERGKRGAWLLLGHSGFRLFVGSPIVPRYHVSYRWAQASGLFADLLNQLLDAGDALGALKPEHVVVRLVLRRVRLDSNTKLDLVRPQVLQKPWRVVVGDANKVGIKVVFHSRPLFDDGHNGEWVARLGR